MRTSKRALNLLTQVAITVFLLWAIAAYQARDLPSGPAPKFALKTLDGVRVDNQSLRGKPTMLVFWAPWCGVCKFASENVSWLRKLKGESANVVSIASAYQSETQVRDYVRAQEVDYPVLLGGMKAAHAFGVHAYPTVFFLDEQGQIKRGVIGYTSTLGMWLRL